MLYRIKYNPTNFQSIYQNTFLLKHVKNVERLTIIRAWFLCNLQSIRKVKQCIQLELPKYMHSISAINLASIW